MQHNNVKAKNVEMPSGLLGNYSQSQNGKPLFAMLSMLEHFKILKCTHFK